MNEVPLYLFIFLMLVMFYFMLQALSDTNIHALVSCFVSIIMAFALAKISINGQLVQTFAGVSSNDTVVTGTQSIQVSWLGWLFTLLGLAMVILTIMLLVTMYRNTYDEVTE